MGKYWNGNGRWGILMPLNEPGIVLVLHIFTSFLWISLTLPCKLYFHHFINEDGVGKTISSQTNSNQIYMLSLPGIIRKKEYFVFYQENIRRNSREHVVLFLTFQLMVMEDEQIWLFISVYLFWILLVYWIYLSVLVGFFSTIFWVLCIQYHVICK